MLVSWLSSTRKFIDEHPNIIITKMDKGNSTVIIDKIDYISKMNKLLSDYDTYLLVQKDPTKMLTNSLHDLLVDGRTRATLIYTRTKC